MTFERVNYALRYDHTIGLFYWRVALSDKTRIGVLAGGINAQGYRRIKIDGHYYLAHRLAWLLTHGVWPSAEIDHKNRIKSDNRLPNLREATHSQNHANVGLRSDNSTGFKGVQFSKQKGKYQAIAEKEGKRFHIAFFDDPATAHAAYCAKAKELFGAFHDRGI